MHHQNIKCPVGKRACAWVHPHFTFTADCRLNWATFPRFLAPENVLVRPSRIFSRSRHPVTPKRGHWLSPVASLFRPAAKFTPFLISQILPATSQLIYLSQKVRSLLLDHRNMIFFSNPYPVITIFFSPESICVNVKFTASEIQVKNSQSRTMTNVEYFIIRIFST